MAIPACGVPPNTWLRTLCRFAAGCSSLQAPVKSSTRTAENLTSAAFVEESEMWREGLSAVIRRNTFNASLTLHVCRPPQQECSCATIQHPAGRREGLRDCSGKARARQGAPLHACGGDGGTRLGSPCSALSVSSNRLYLARSEVACWSFARCFSNMYKACPVCACSHPFSSRNRRCCPAFIVCCTYCQVLGCSLRFPPPKRCFLGYDTLMPSSPALCTLARDRVAFGKVLSEDSLVRHHVAQSRMEIDQVRWLNVTGLLDKCDVFAFFDVRLRIFLRYPRYFILSRSSLRNKLGPGIPSSFAMLSIERFEDLCEVVDNIFGGVQKNFHFVAFFYIPTAVVRRSLPIGMNRASV